MDQGAPPISFGSGSNLLGGGDAIAQAIARRSTGDASATDQVSPAAPTFDPSTQPAQQLPGQAPAAPQQPAQPQQPGSMNAMGQMTSPSDDTLIIKALTQQLKNNHEIKRVQGGMA